MLNINNRKSGSLITTLFSRYANSNLNSIKYLEQCCWTIIVQIYRSNYFPNILMFSFRVFGDSISVTPSLSRCFRQTTTCSFVTQFPFKVKEWSIKKYIYIYTRFITLFRVPFIGGHNVFHIAPVILKYQYRSQIKHSYLCNGNTFRLQFSPVSIFFIALSLSLSDTSNGFLSKPLARIEIFYSRHVIKREHGLQKVTNVFLVTLQSHPLSIQSLLLLLLSLRFQVTSSWC